MNTFDSQSGPGDGAPRKNLLRHHELKREREQGPGPETIPPDLPPADADLPSSTSLKSALARANLLEDPGKSAIPDDTEPHRSAELDPNARSSLPLALARANESRKLPPNPIEPDEPEDADVGEGPSLTDFFFRFDRFSNQVHPLRGWFGFSLFFGLTALALGHGWALRSLPSHPGALRVGDTGAFWVGHLGRSFGIGTGCIFILSVISLILYRAAKGAPPFLWVFKILVYALAPLTLVWIYLLLDLSDVGLEAYFRGYRPESWFHFAQTAYSAAAVWAAVRVLQSASSRHCQASPRKIALPLGLLLVFGLGGIWGHSTILQILGRESLDTELSRAEFLFQNADDQAQLETEALGSRESPAWTHALKVRLYRLRGEIRYLSGNVGGAREDMIRLVRMHPSAHPMTAYGRAVNFLAMGQSDEALRLLEAVNLSTEGEMPDVVRWLYRIRRGDFGERGRDEVEAERLARQLQYAEPNALHLEMAVEAMFAAGQNRRILRELAEAERMNIPVTAKSAFFGALAALDQEQFDLAERWWARALAKGPLLVEDARAAPLLGRFTSRP
ncbi:MAG: hypothetical protein JJU05_14470 [Verrucomicrobia bacterium]|nr:hypothetical protein [Verrucomicrobiota bacterium]MCH8529068.1 YIP1 family protein [Kiritimatiellia bacterium]